MIAKYAFSNQNSVFIHMAHLQFPDLCPLPEHWLQLLNTQPQTQVSIEQADTELNISASIHGAGINVIVIKEILVRMGLKQVGNELQQEPENFTMILSLEFVSALFLKP